MGRLWSNLELKRLQDGRVNDLLPVAHPEGALTRTPDAPIAPSRAKQKGHYEYDSRR
jgi:hypothetical protein